MGYLFQITARLSILYFAFKFSKFCKSVVDIFAFGNGQGFVAVVAVVAVVVAVVVIALKRVYFLNTPQMTSAKIK